MAALGLSSKGRLLAVAFKVLLVPAHLSIYPTSWPLSSSFRRGLLYPLSSGSAQPRALTHLLHPPDPASLQVSVGVPAGGGFHEEGSAGRPFRDGMEWGSEASQEDSLEEES